MITETDTILSIETKKKAVELFEKIVNATNQLLGGEQKIEKITLINKNKNAIQILTNCLFEDFNKGNQKQEIIANLDEFGKGIPFQINIFIDRTQTNFLLLK